MDVVNLFARHRTGLTLERPCYIVNDVKDSDNLKYHVEDELHKLQNGVRAT